jgi:hypothetical protein
MSLNESIVEDAALTTPAATLTRPLTLRGSRPRARFPRGEEWDLGYAVGHGPHLAPGEPAAERDSFGEVLLVGRLREALRRLNPAIKH